MLGIRPPDETVPRWHVSPIVDLLAYHFSWVFALVPLLFLGDRHPQDYLPFFLAILGGNFAHQALSLPLVYLDGEVFRKFRLRCTVFPLLMAAGFVLCLARWRWVIPPFWLTAVDVASVAGAILVLVQLWWLGRRGAVASPWLVILAGVVPFLPWLVTADPGRWELLAGLALLSVVIARESPQGPARWAAPKALAIVALWALLDPRATTGLLPWKPLRFFLVISTVSAIAYLWNFWHVYMQKYGILRVYNAKAGRPVPAWVDRLFVFGWLPLTVVVLGTRYRGYLLSHYPVMRVYLKPFLDWLEAHEAWLMAPTIGVAAASVGLFVRQEWVSFRFRNLPRLSMGLGTGLLFASALVFNPVKSVLAFGFSHLVEYFVFVWAYERRRYCAPLPHRPPLALLLRHPAIAYPAFLAVVGGGYLLFRSYGDRLLEPYRAGRRPPVTMAQILLLIGIFNAMIHFYFDGFLWKMRQPAVSRNI